MVQAILLPVRLVAGEVAYVEEVDCYLLVSIVAWFAVRTKAKCFSGTRAFHGNGLIDWKVKIHEKMQSKQRVSEHLQAASIFEWALPPKSHIKVPIP